MRELAVAINFQRVRYPPLTGRVVSKSRIVHFGKSSSGSGGGQGHPYFFEFLFQDDSGTVKVTVWNSAARRWYNTFGLGDVVKLTGFKIKPPKFAVDEKVELR